MTVRSGNPLYRRGKGASRLMVICCLLGLAALASACRGRDGLKGRYRGANVLLLVMDTTRADRLGCYGYFRPTSPFIDRFAEENFLFEEAYTSIPVTLPAHASMLTGLYPQQHGVFRNTGRINDGTVSLAEILRDQGYRTGAVVGTAVLESGTNIERGFDVYLENWGISDRVPPPEENLPWEFKGLAEDGNRMALDWLAREPGKPYFLMINYYDVHAPYVEIEGFKDMFDPFSAEMEEYLRTSYEQVPYPKWKWETITFVDRSIAYLDSELEKFFSRLEEMGLLENTIVILTADHGNGLFQHQDYGHHGKLLYEGHIRIPLIVSLPEGGRGRVRGLVETVDFAPTVLDLLGLSGLKRPDGVSFLPLLAGGRGGKDRVYAMNVPKEMEESDYPLSFAVRSREGKIIHTVGGETLFFRLDRDPNELSGGGIPDDRGKRALVERLLRRGREWYQLSKITAGRTEEVSPERVRALRALGYL